MDELHYGPIEKIVDVPPAGKRPERLAVRQARMVERHAAKFPGGYEFLYDSSDKTLTMQAPED